MRRVVVIGAGLAGLTVAVRCARKGDRVVLFEASRRAGGQLWTEHSEGYVVEHGAEGFVAGSEAVRTLAAELGIAAGIVEQSVSTSFGFDGCELRALAPGAAADFLGFRVPRSELGKGIRSFDAGMGDLVAALESAASGRVELHKATPARRIETSGSELHVVLDDGRHVTADAIVVATGLRAAPDLLEPEFGVAAAGLRESRASSSVTVSLGFERGAIEHSLAGTGFVIAEAAQQDGLRACTFTSSKLPKRAPADRALVRLFFRPSADDAARLDDAEWIARAERGFARAVTVRSRPLRTWISRWNSALPVSDDAHFQRVTALEDGLRGSGVHLAGAAFHGSGIDAAVRSAFRALLALD